MYSTAYQTRGQFYFRARGPYVQPTRQEGSSILVLGGLCTYSTVYQTRGQFYFRARARARGPYVQYSLPDKRAVLC